LQISSPPWSTLEKHENQSFIFEKFVNVPGWRHHASSEILFALHYVSKLVGAGWYLVTVMERETVSAVIFLM